MNVCCVASLFLAVCIRVQQKTSRCLRIYSNVFEYVWCSMCWITWLETCFWIPLTRSLGSSRREHFNFISVSFSIGFFFGIARRTEEISWSNTMATKIVGVVFRSSWESLNLLARWESLRVPNSMRNYHIPIRRFNFSLIDWNGSNSVNRPCMTFNICRVNTEIEVHLFLPKCSSNVVVEINSSNSQ